jgi:hypothetical protein
VVSARFLLVCMCGLGVTLNVVPPKRLNVGTVTCTCECAFPTEVGVHDFVVEATHTDTDGVVCAKTQAVWNIKITAVETSTERKRE